MKGLVIGVTEERINEITKDLKILAKTFGFPQSKKALIEFCFICSTFHSYTLEETIVFTTLMNDVFCSAVNAENHELSNEKSEQNADVKTTIDKIVVYTDGACRDNHNTLIPSQGGWAFTCDINGAKFEHSDNVNDTTNNRMEIMAIVKAIELLPPCDKLEIITDSTYAKGVLTGEFKAKTNLDLIQIYQQYIKGKNIKITWEPRNASNGNKRANAMAQFEAQRNIINKT